MVVINAVVGYSREDGKFLAYGGFEMPQMGVGDDVEKAISDLEKAVRSTIDIARGDESIGVHRDSGFPRRVAEAFDNLILDNASPNFVREMPGYGTLHIYTLRVDFSGDEDLI